METLDRSPPVRGQNDWAMLNVRGTGGRSSWYSGLSSRMAPANSRTFPRSTGNVTSPRCAPMMDVSAMAPPEYARRLAVGTDNREDLAARTSDVPADAGLTAVLREFDLCKAVIAAVNGLCAAGGMEMLLGTDIRIAGEGASFGIFEPKRGLFPGGGTTVRLPRQIPYPWAMEILLTGQALNAATAFRMGLVNRVVPPEELLPEARRWAERIME